MNEQEKLAEEKAFSGFTGNEPKDRDEQTVEETQGKEVPEEKPEIQKPTIRKPQ